MIRIVHTTTKLLVIAAGKQVEETGCRRPAEEALASLLLRTGPDPNEVLIGEGPQDRPSILAELEDPVAGLLVRFALSFLEEEGFRDDVNPPSAGTTVVKQALIFCQGAPIRQALEERNPPFIQPDNDLAGIGDLYFPGTPDPLKLLAQVLHNPVVESHIVALHERTWITGASSK